MAIQKLVFYVCGHMFCFFDLNDFQVISLKCQPERIDELKAEYDGVAFEDLPEDWKCPRCKQSKDKFNKA